MTSQIKLCVQIPNNHQVSSTEYNVKIQDLLQVQVRRYILPAHFLQQI